MGVLPAVAGLAAVLALAPGAAAAWSLIDPGQGPVTLSGPARGRELSALAWAGGRDFYAVGDSGGMLYRLTIDIEPQRGTITAAAADGGVRLAGARDLEGLVYARGTGTVVVADEAGPALREHRPTDGALLRRLPIPPIYQQVRSNRSLESLAADAALATWWTGNEETLRCDGDRSTYREGSVVRLQRLDREFAAAGQWAYRTDPIPGGDGEPRRVDSSGLSDLLVLPDGTLLALERAFGPGGFRTRIYALDLTGATDVSSLPSLAGATFTPVAKRLLWEHRSTGHNFEGFALGPPLDGGGHSVVLVADDGHGFRAALYALTLRR